MQFHLSWETAPGLGGLRCEGFRAVATVLQAPAGDVAMECASAAAAAQFARVVEEHFAKKRFPNAAAAFEAVKSFVLERAPDHEI